MRYEKSKQSLNFLNTSHNLGSKYACNACKPKAKFCFWDTRWKSDTKSVSAILVT